MVRESFLNVSECSRVLTKSTNVIIVIKFPNEEIVKILTTFVSHSEHFKVIPKSILIILMVIYCSLSFQVYNCLVNDQIFYPWRSVSKSCPA